MKVSRTILLSVIIGILFGGTTFVTGATKLTWWNLSSRKELTEKIIADFHKENPDIKITPVLNTPSEYQQQLKVAASSGSLPDFWFNWGGTLGSFYSENGLTMNLNDFAKKNGWDKKFSPTALSLSTFDGKLSGYPTSINMIGVFYRKDVFDECGLTAPKTFDEFEKAMATLKEKGFTPMVVAGTPGWHMVRLTEALIESFAGSAEKDKLYAMKSAWNSPAVISAFKKIKEYGDKGYFPKGYVTLSGNDAKSNLYSKDAVMSLEGPWMESNILNDKQDPKLYGYFKMPLAKGNRMSGFVEMTQFNKKLNKKKLAAAMKFIDYIYSPKSIQKYGGLIKQPVPRKDNKLPENLKMVAEMIKDLDKFGSYTISDQGLPQDVVNNGLFVAQQAIATGDKTPEEAAKFMDDQIKAYKASQ